MPSASTSKPPPTHRQERFWGQASPQHVESRFHEGRAAGKDVPVMSTAEPGTGPVTFRAMFVEELRARREQIGLLQREFAEKAHVSLSSVKQYEAGKRSQAESSSPGAMTSTGARGHSSGSMMA
jgi:DNA-binding transcriptional regulator YiaG